MAAQILGAHSACGKSGCDHPSAICSVDDCPNGVFARGWCSKHYHRWRSAGELELLHECVQCGGVFQGRKKRFCSAKCRDTHYRLERGFVPRWSDGIPESHKEHECQHCGVTFKPKRAGRTTYCSRECYTKSIQVAAAIRRKLSNLSKPPKPPRPVKPPRACVVCNSPTPSQTQKYCSAHCRKAGGRSHRPCQRCGTDVLGTKGKKHCRDCAKAVSRERQQARHGKVNKHRHRARLYGVEYEPINPIVVFDRDGWRCQVCGVKTPKRLRGTYKPTAPELDHRIPISRGGSHTWDNVQCSCRSCNIDKAAVKVVGQMNMFPEHRAA